MSLFQIVPQLIDGELDDASRSEALKRISGDSSACETWGRYHLIGSVIRNETRIAGRDLCADIMAKLEDEPTVLAPVIKTEKKNNRAEVFKSAGLFALAASIALVAVVTLSPVAQVGPGEQVVSTETQTNQDADSFTQEFEAMLAEHGEFTASPGLNGLIAYAKLVSNQELDQ